MDYYEEAVLYIEGYRRDDCQWITTICMRLCMWSAGEIANKLQLSNYEGRKLLWRGMEEIANRLLIGRRLCVVHGEVQRRHGE